MAGLDARRDRARIGRESRQLRTTVTLGALRLAKAALRGTEDGFVQQTAWHTGAKRRFRAARHLSSAGERGYHSPTPGHFFGDILDSPGLIDPAAELGLEFGGELDQRLRVGPWSDRSERLARPTDPGI